MPLTNFPNGITSFGIPIYGNPTQDMSGTTYFADSNYGKDGNPGKSLDKPFQTLTAALATSHADIARGSDRWARRNTIWIAGDDFVEDLDLLAQKTDIIGMGSSDNYPMPCIRGNHVPITSGSGCRFFNVRFRPTASEDLFTLTSTIIGLEFWKCFFEAQYSTFTAPSAIDSTGCKNVRIIGNKFSGAFSSDYIDIGAGHANHMEIAYNRMIGSADNGIMTTDTVTVEASHMGAIHHNFVQCADITIDTQTTSVFNVYDNQLISANAVGATSYVIDLTYASNNMLTGNDVSAVIPDIGTN